MHCLPNLKICIAKQAKQIFHYKRNLILCNLYKKIVYQVGINKGIILRCTAYQISSIELSAWYSMLKAFGWIKRGNTPGSIL